MKEKEGRLVVVMAELLRPAGEVDDDEAQRNFTDPDSRIMSSLGGRGFPQSYNCQAMLDSTHQVIVAAQATIPPRTTVKCALIRPPTGVRGIRARPCGSAATRPARRTR